MRNQCRYNFTLTDCTKGDKSLHICQYFPSEKELYRGSWFFFWGGVLVLDFFVLFCFCFLSEGVDVDINEWTLNEEQ